MIDRRQLILLVIMLAVVGLGETVFLFFWGGTWNTRMFTFQRLLGELAEPPGWQPESDYLYVTAYSPLGIRSYNVNGTFDHVIDFLRREAIRSGWTLQDEEVSPLIQQGDGSYLLVLKQRFTYREHYCLETGISWDTNRERSQVGARVRVHLDIYENGQCDRMSMR